MIVIGSQSYKVVLDICSVEWTVCDYHRVTELQGGVEHLFCGVDSVTVIGSQSYKVVLDICSVKWTV